MNNEQWLQVCLRGAQIQKEIICCIAAECICAWLRVCINVTVPVQTAPQNQAAPGTRGPQSARTVAWRHLPAWGKGWGGFSPGKDLGEKKKRYYWQHLLGRWHHAEHLGYRMENYYLKIDQNKAESLCFSMLAREKKTFCGNIFVSFHSVWFPLC